jgi:hypothetical protein
MQGEAQRKFSANGPRAFAMFAADAQSEKSRNARRVAAQGRKIREGRNTLAALESLTSQLMDHGACVAITVISEPTSVLRGFVLMMRFEARIRAAANH